MLHLSLGFSTSYLIGCSISVERNTDLIVALVLAGQSDACPKGNLDSFRATSYLDEPRKSGFVVFGTIKDTDQSKIKTNK